MNIPFITKEKTLLDGTIRDASYSPCMKYRYHLRSTWQQPELEDEEDYLCFLMLNPSTATEEQNDPTIERIERRARMKGYGGFMILNLFAYRATDPMDMKKQLDPIGPENDWFIEDALMSAPAIICGWGTHGAHMNRNKDVMKLFEKYERTPVALGWTKDNHPQHPLYISYDKQPHER